MVAMVIWYGNGIHYQIDSVQNEISGITNYLMHKLLYITLHIIMSCTVTLYECRSLAVGCSLCIRTRMESGFMCGWCGGTCEVMEECKNQFITTGSSCPNPTITSFSPKSGALTKRIMYYLFE